MSDTTTPAPDLMQALRESLDRARLERTELQANTRAYDYWSMADTGEIGVVFPAAAVASANRLLQAGWDA